MAWLHGELRSMSMAHLPSGHRGRGWRGGRGPLGRRGLPSFASENGKDRGPIHARLLMSQGQLASVIRQHAKMASTTGAVGLLAAAILTAAWRMSMRSREQRAALELAEAHNQHLRELQFAGAGLAHEMKNPLNVIRGTAQTMRQNGHRTDAERQALERMLDEIDRVVSRLNEFLSFSRIPEPEWADVSAEEVVEEIASLLEHGEEGGEARITVDDLPTIRADGALFRQVVFNLLHNAMRATEDGGSIRVQAVHDGQSRITMEFIDTGVGVSDDLRDKLFRPYCSGWEGGTGLGLSIVRQIALAHGWKVGCRPNDDQGTTFWVSDIEGTKDEATGDSKESPDRR